MLFIKEEPDFLLSSIQDVVEFFECHCIQDLGIETSRVLVIRSSSEADAGTLSNKVTELFRVAIHDRVGLINNDQLTLSHNEIDTVVVLYLPCIHKAQVGGKLFLISLQELLAVIDHMYLAVQTKHQREHGSSMLYPAFTLTRGNTPELSLMLRESAKTVLSQRELSFVGCILHHHHNHGKAVIL